MRMLVLDLVHVGLVKIAWTICMNKEGQIQKANLGTMLALEPRHISIADAKTPDIQSLQKRCQTKSPSHSSVKITGRA